MMRSLLLIVLVGVAWLHAADPAELLPRLAAEDASERIAAIKELSATGDPRLAAFFEDYRQGSGYLLDGKVVLVPELNDDAGIALDPLTRKPVSATPVTLKQLTELPISRRERIAASDSINRLRFYDPDPAVRLAAVTKAGDAAQASDREALGEISSADKDPKIRRAATEGAALIDLASADPAIRAAACRMLGDLVSARANDRLRDLAAKDGEATVKSAAGQALAAIESWHSKVKVAQTAFSGISAGSILIVMALGLSITFGLMGVINMAHGEMLMIGAYATLMVQWGFTHLPPSLQPYYFLFGLVAGFVAAGTVGWLIELTIIRHLYGRPLETLLATWGVSFLLIQGVRDYFGDNQAVTAPPWLVGGWEPMIDLVLPWNRLFIIAVTIVSIAVFWLLLNRSRLGLLVRATVQSRRTASSLGVNTRRIDGFTFALGSGLAGAAGCALTLIGGLKPDMGQEYIIDSFLVVAAGGVGNLWGVVCSGLGLGILSKVLEPWTQAVYAKVIVLAVVVIFLQRRPQGLFPQRGRLADA